MVVSKEKCIGVDLHDVTGPADDVAALQKSRDQVLGLLAGPHDDYLIAVTYGFICRTVKRLKKSVFK